AANHVGSASTLPGTASIPTRRSSNLYQLASTTLTTTADITPATVHGHITAANKSYDGTVAAAIASRTVTASDVFGSDVVTLTGGMGRADVWTVVTVRTRMRTAVRMGG